MATFVLTNAFISVGGTDLSDHVRTITVDYSAELPDDTVMSDDTRSVAAGGLFNWTVTVEWLQDFAATKVDVTLFPLVGTAPALIIRPDSGAKSATNPEYTGSGVLGTYSPITGSVGDMATAPSVFTAAGTLARGV